MKKNIKDYLHLYLGCECEALVKYSETSQKWVKGYLAGIVKGKPQAQLYDAFGNAWELLHETEEIKPILRPLPDLTNDEAKVLGYNRAIDWWRDHGHFGTHSAKNFAYLLKQGFDLFGLIESGLAIDKTKLNRTITV